MRLLTLEHGKFAYRVDFLLYASAVPALIAWVACYTPKSYWLTESVWVAGGLVGWTAVEYALHRFVLHGLQPFCRWHDAHHRRPTALICAPTLFSAGLFAVLVFAPAWELGGLWCACSLLLGLLTGYLVYAITHHATHHWRSDNRWLQNCKRRHALHHHARQPCCYGVTNSFWDHVFRTTASVR